MSSSSATIFQPVELGHLRLRNRVVMAPLTRMRGDHATGVLPDYSVEYYKQRASAGMIVVEATNISQIAKGYEGSPGIWTDDHVKSWKRITEAVHKEGCIIMCQLWHTGIVSHVKMHPSRANAGPSTGEWNTRTNYCDDKGENIRGPCGPSEAMTLDEIKQTVQDYAHATRMAKQAGFDGVEVHGAHGYLLHQFMCPSVNKRDDQYSATTFENRCRFLNEVMDSVCEAWGDSKCVGVRVSPLGTFNNIANVPEPKEFALYLFKLLATKDLAYVHLSEPDWLKNFSPDWKPTDTLDDEGMCELRSALGSTKFIGSGGYDKQKAEKRICKLECIDAVAFGRPFIPNPDLVARLKNDWPLVPFDPSCAYTGGRHGMTDYPAYDPAAPAV